MHEYAPLANTLVAVFAGILINKSDHNGLTAETNRGFDRTDREIDDQIQRHRLAPFSN